MKALVVDDNYQNLYLLQTLLGANGFTVVGVSNGLKALDQLRRQRFQVIISDILMPQMDGFQFCREVKTDPTLRHLPFLFYTATYTSPEDETFARSLGADAFFIKPMEPADFLTAVRAALAWYAEGAPRPSSPPAVEVKDTDYFRQYNVRLVQKLEQKLLQLEEAHRELRRSENLFHTLAQAAPVGIFRVNPAGEHDYVNDRWCEITGIARKFATVSAWQAAVHPEDRARVTGEWRRALGQGGVFQSDFRIRKADDTVSWVLGQASPLAERVGSQPAYVGTFTDISRQKKLEQERAEIQMKLHQAQKLEAIGTLVNGISHDFNNLVGAIFGYAELAQRELASAEGAGEDLKLLIRAAERAKELTGQILRFSRKQNEELKPVQVGPVVKEALSLLRASMPGNVRCTERVATNLPSVLADSTQIHQVVMNLMTNALYALREKGGELELTVEAMREQPAPETLAPDLGEGDYLVLCVRDTGCGIRPELLPRVFDPFFTTKPPDEGTGMGLAVVHGIVKGHGGEIRVKSDLGQGTTFTVYLPAIAAQEPAPATEEEGLTRGQGQRLLYVDNEYLLTGMVKRMLEVLGYRATVFDEAPKALDYVRAHSKEFDLLISDLDMPGLSGPALARRVWEVRPGLPVLFVSGVSKSLTREAARHLGACDMLLKPFDLRALGEAVADALRGEKAMNPS